MSNLLFASKHNGQILENSFICRMKPHVSRTNLVVRMEVAAVATGHPELYAFPTASPSPTYCFVVFRLMLQTELTLRLRPVYRAIWLLYWPSITPCLLFSEVISTTLSTVPEQPVMKTGLVQFRLLLHLVAFLSPHFPRDFRTHKSIHRKS